MHGEIDHQSMQRLPSAQKLEESSAGSAWILLALRDHFIHWMISSAMAPEFPLYDRAIAHLKTIHRQDSEFALKGGKKTEMC